MCLTAHLVFHGALLAQSKQASPPSINPSLSTHRVQYAEENEEWMMEKNRFYCELPGDVWEEGLLMRLIKTNQQQTVRVR